jgi:hypothetical protein
MKKLKIDNGFTIEITPTPENGVHDYIVVTNNGVYINGELFYKCKLSFTLTDKD